MDINTHSTLKTGLVAYWTLDANLNDSHTGAHHGAFYNTPTFPVAKLRTGVNLNGSSQYGKVLNDVAFQGTTVSFSFWFKADTLPGSYAYLLNHGTNRYVYLYYTGYLVVKTPDGMFPIQMFSTNPISVGVWYHVCVVQAGGSSYFYLNNVLQTSATSMMPQSVSADIFFGSTAVPNSYFDGILDDFGWWDKGLSSNERIDLYQSGVGITWDGTFNSMSTHPTLLSGLLAHYKFDGDCTDVLAAYNGTPQNSPTYVSGKLNQAIHLDGINQRVSLGNSSGLNPDYMSIVTWAKRSQEFAGYTGLCTRYTAGTSYRLRATIGKLHWDVTTSSPSGSEWIELPWDDLNWHLWIGTFDGANIKLSKDGGTFSEKARTGVIAKTSNTVYVGHEPGNYYFPGDLDTMSIYNRPLIQSEAIDFYAGGFGLPFIVTSRAPRVKTPATVLSTSQVRVDFDELMQHNTALTLPQSYVFDGPSTLAPQGVTAEDVSGETRATLVFTGEMRTGGAYTVEASGMIDVNDSLPVNPSYDTASFTGLGVAPQINPEPVSSEHTELVIRFDSAVLGADNPANYSLSIEIDDIEQYGDIYTYRLTTGPQLYLEDYILTVLPGVTDLAGNPIDPAHDTVTFVGKANDPPVCTLVYPDSETQNFPLRDSIQVLAADQQRGVGIDETTWDITLTYQTSEGLVTLRPLVGGVLQMSFMGVRSGDPDDPAGVSWTFVPVTGWRAGTLYTVNSEVFDKEELPNSDPGLGTFETGVAVYIEDMVLTRTETDTKLLTPSTDQAKRNGQSIKNMLILHGTQSRDQTVQARTLLWWASRTEARSTVLSVTDFSSIANLKFGNRTSVIDLYARMSGYVPTATRATSEITNAIPGVRDLLRKLLRADNPLHVLSAMAAIAILSAFQE
jgi:hypothetical protein